MAKRYGSLILALLLAVAFAGAAAAAEAAGKAKAAAEGHGGIASGIQCDKQCIMSVQKQLKQQGMYKGPVDGVAGRKTQAAVKKFQSQKGLQATGQIDEQTLSQMNVQPSGKGGAMPSGEAGKGGMGGGEVKQPTLPGAPSGAM